MEDQLKQAAEKSKMKADLTKERNGKMRKAKTSKQPWKCKLCITSEDECGSHCTNSSWDAVSKEIKYLQSQNQGCLKGSITTVPSVGCSPAVSMDTELDPIIEPSRKYDYCRAAFRSESARRYGQALLKQSRLMRTCDSERPSPD